MKALGYNEKGSIEECSVVKGFCDLYVPITKKIALPIEIKSSKYPLKITEVHQLQGYASGKGQRFGLLTNGYEYLLADYQIQPTPTIKGHSLESYVVFWFDIFNEKGEGKNELKFFKYLSCKHIYENSVSYFLVMLHNIRSGNLHKDFKGVLGYLINQHYTDFLITIYLMS